MANLAFSGSFDHSLDGKGRVIIPASFREALGEDFTITILRNHLIPAIFPNNTFAVVRAIKENAHYMTNADISRATGLDLPAVIEATSWLAAHKVIQQDQRSIRAGHRMVDAEAFFFTVDNPCARGLIGTIIENLL